MKAAFLVRTFDVGGAERQIIALAHGLVERRHDVLVVVVESGGTLIPALRATGAQVVEVTNGGIGELTLRLPRLVRSLRRFEPDVLYAQLAYSNVLAVLCRLFLPRTRTVQGILVLRPERDPDALLVRALYTAESVSSRFVDAVIANSQTARRQSIDRGFPTDRIHVVYNGIDTDLFCRDPVAGKQVRAEWSIADDELLIGRVGRMRPTKDYPTFLRAAARVADQRPDARFAVVGDGPDREPIHALASELGLGDRMVWAGERADMPAVMNALDLMVSSSTSESLANVIGEAMACGVPCAVTEAGDSAAIVGPTGVIVPVRAPDALAEGILHLAGRLEADRDELQAAARARIEDHYGVEAMVDATERILLDLASERA